MPEPERNTEDEAAKLTPAKSTPADATIPAEEAREDAETASEAKEEAENLDAIPYDRLKKDEGD